MKRKLNFLLTTTFLVFAQSIALINAQTLPPKQPYPYNVKQIHSGHSLTDPLFNHWPGQYVNLIGQLNNANPGTLFNTMVGKSTIPGSSLLYRWNNAPGFGSPDARHDITNWELLVITERVPMAIQGQNNQQWYLDWLQEQKTYLSYFVNNAWTNGNNGNGAPTLLWTTWVGLNESNWRQLIELQGEEFERMQDYANANKPANAPHVYLIPGHKMMARLYDDIAANLVPGITNINQFFSDNIHLNELGDYAVSLIHYACIFNQSPVGLPNNLLPSGAPSSALVPSPALAQYLQNMIWDVVTLYPRTGITNNSVPTSISLPNQKAAIEVKNTFFSENLIINNLNNQHDELYVYNTLGKYVKNIRLNHGENIINLSDLEQGIYFLKGNNLSTVKILKIN